MEIYESRFDRESTLYSQNFFPRTLDLTETSPDKVRHYFSTCFSETFDRYESLFECLANEEAFYKKPISLRHPLIFYFGHTATFFINKLLLARLLSARINPHFESLFSVGVDEMSWDDLNDDNYLWPTPSEVKKYRDQVRHCVLDLIANAPLELPINWNNPWWALVMGIEHERIHLETSSVLIRQHQLKFVKSSPNWPSYPIAITFEDSVENSLVNVPTQKITLGKKFNDFTYGWDNEYGQEEFTVESFSAAKMLVSNAEYLAFVEADGYTNSLYWCEEGNSWRLFTQHKHPIFWLKNSEGSYSLRLMTKVVPMQWNWPVEVNQLEASAFCVWKTHRENKRDSPYRLPSENQWYALAKYTELDEVGEKISDSNLHLDYWASSCPVNFFSQGDFFDVRGNVWQWTTTPIYPLNGFQTHPLYDDFTTPTFDDRHVLLKGGSWISTGNEARLSARYAFRRHFFQHAGFRYIQGGKGTDSMKSHYETDKLLAEYAEFHYGDNYFGVENFSKALVDYFIKIAAPYLTQLQRPLQCLDIGCASGRASFELAKYFDSVIGIDFSARFIQQGVLLKDSGVLRYAITSEGELVNYKTRTLKELSLEETKERVNFFQGDACNLKSQFKNYDAVFAANLIDRLYDPSKFLSEISDRINSGGLLFIASPYTWLEEHTPRDKWLGGYKKDGETFTTRDGLLEVLKNSFDLINEPHEIPFVIKETARKFQHSLADVTIWRKK